MAEIVPLDFLRTNKPLRECLREVLAKQSELTARQKELEDMVWAVEHGIPVRDGMGNPLEPTVARERVAQGLYQAIAAQQTLKMYRSHLRRCIRAAARKIKKVESILDRANAIAGGPAAWKSYVARKYIKAAGAAE